MVYSSELEELQSLIQFPEEVGLMLATKELRLFSQVPPNAYVRYISVELHKLGIQTHQKTVKDLLIRLKEVSHFRMKLKCD